jgi:polyisoprenyl-teichoic acid--peptidoglycan teichoic acid transferase
MAALSATAGALLAVSLSSTPLLQTHLSAEESAIFNQTGDSPFASGNMSLAGLNRPVNILVLGTKVLTSDLDTPPPVNEGYHSLVNSFDGLSDTMLLLRFNPENHKLSLLSIPRDTRTQVGQLGMVKINEANAEGGPAMAAQTVSQLLNGIGVDRYVRLNVQGIEKLIDALGGIQVHVPIDMHYQDDSQHLYINLKAGDQRLNGKKALEFLRFRYDENGDIGRIQRQQSLMRAFMEQVLTPATVTKLPQILSIIRSHLDTNLTVEELFSLVSFGAQTQRSDVQMLMLPGSFSDPAEYKASFWLPNYEAINTLTAQYFGVGNTIAPDQQQQHQLRIAIQDSTTQPEAIDKLQEVLGQEGYSHIFSYHPWPETLQVTRIVAQRGDEESARNIQRALGIGEVRVDSTGELDSDITIQLGRDWVQQVAIRRRTPASIKP